MIRLLCNLIVSMTNNNEPMNRAATWAAQNTISKAGNHRGSAQRSGSGNQSYDPCLSCATHAMGKMPLGVGSDHQDNPYVKDQGILITNNSSILIYVWKSMQ